MPSRALVVVMHIVYVNELREIYEQRLRSVWLLVHTRDFNYLIFTNPSYLKILLSESVSGENEVQVSSIWKNAFLGSGAASAGPFVVVSGCVELLSSCHYSPF